MAAVFFLFDVQQMLTGLHVRILVQITYNPGRDDCRKVQIISSL
jgi:hypothetical protein